LKTDTPKEINNLAAMCLHMDPDSRPDIEQVLAILNQFDIDRDPEALLIFSVPENQVSSSSAPIASDSNLSGIRADCQGGIVVLS